MVIALIAGASSSSATSNFAGALMHNRESILVPVAGFIACVLGYSALLGQDIQAKAGDAASRSSGEVQEQQQNEKLEYFRERLKLLHATTADQPDKPLSLVEAPLITFENPVSQMLDGFMFVWTDRGRPAAAMKCYYHSLNKRWGRTFVSLATEPIKMSQAGKPLWTPADAGLSFAPLPQKSKPADDPRRRLTQMRDIARRFTMVDHWGLKDPTDWRLRLLTTPLFRYEAPELGTVDGAMFGYVANSPEALVLVEARKSPEGLVWYYAVSRMTRFEVTVSLDEEQVAHFPRLESWPASGTYFHAPVEMPNYPFQRAGDPAPAKE